MVIPGLLKAAVERLKRGRERLGLPLGRAMFIPCEGAFLPPMCADGQNAYKRWDVAP